MSGSLRRIWAIWRLKKSAQRSKASLSGSPAKAQVALARADRCSTLESVVVGFTRSRTPQPIDRSLLNARKRRCRVHSILGATIPGLTNCSTLESVVVGFTSATSISPSRPPRLLNARKRRCRVHPSETPATRPETAAQRSKASLSGSRESARFSLPSKSACSTLESVVVGFTPKVDAPPGRHRLLNARKRRCRVHACVGGESLRRSDCSTLESVVVGFTKVPGGNTGLLVRLLNARKRRCRVHIGMSIDRDKAMPSAQRSKASLSGSHPSQHRPRRLGRPAQRSKASLSGSPSFALVANLPSTLLNARKRRCRVHPPDLVESPLGNGLLNARKRRCRVHTARDWAMARANSAQRSKASLSGSRRRGPQRHAPKYLLNARKRRCRVHPGASSGRLSLISCSTLESVVVGFTRSSTMNDPDQGSCSTLESVVVGFTGERRGG